MGLRQARSPVIATRATRSSVAKVVRGWLPAKRASVGPDAVDETSTGVVYDDFTFELGLRRTPSSGLGGSRERPGRSHIADVRTCRSVGLFGFGADLPQFAALRGHGDATPWLRRFRVVRSGTVHPARPIGATRAVPEASTRMRSPGETFISRKRRRTGLVPLLCRTTGQRYAWCCKVRVMVLRALGPTMPNMPVPALPTLSSTRSCDHPARCPVNPPGVHRRHLRYTRPASPRSARGSRRRRLHPARGRHRRSGTY